MLQIKDYLGENFIGQNSLRNEINFAIESYKKTGVFGHCILFSRRGDGKTHLGRLIGENLLNSLNEPRPFIELNGASLKNTKLSSFVNSFVIPHCSGEVTLLLDEAHLISPDILGWLLSVLAPNSEGINRVTFEGQELTFDFRRFTCILASTNIEKIPIALKNRLTIYTLESYKNSELIKILHKNNQEIDFYENVEEDIIDVCRESPRSLIKTYQERILPYCKITGRFSFYKKDWEHLKKHIGIRPLGLESQEVELLKLLKTRGEMTLTSLAAALSLDTKTVRGYIELYLLRKNLIHINGKRQITKKGQDILNLC